MSTTILDIPVTDIDGKETTLSEHSGKVLLVVNVASRCGLTPQYSGLQDLQDKYAAKGFSVLGFPCNDFANQEPEDETGIKTFCDSHSLSGSCVILAGKCRYLVRPLAAGFGLKNLS